MKQKLSNVVNSLDDFRMSLQHQLLSVKCYLFVVLWKASAFVLVLTNTETDLFMRT